MAEARPRPHVWLRATFAKGMKGIAQALKRCSHRLHQAFSLAVPAGDREISPAWFSSGEISALHTVGDCGVACLDDQTWNDLDLDRYIERALGKCSIFGRQWLYARLRAGGSTSRDSGTPTGQLKYLLDHADLGRRVIEATTAMRCAEVEVAVTFFGNAREQCQAWLAWLWVVPAACLAAAVLFAAGFRASGGGLLALALVCSAAVQIHLYAPVSAWHRQKKSIVNLLVSARAWVAAEHLSQVEHEAQTSPERLVDLQSLWAAFRPTWTERIPGLADYANLFLLSQYRGFADDLSLLQSRRHQLQAVYLGMAQLEANAWLADDLRRAPRVCWSQTAAVGDAAFTELTNPMLPDGKTVDLAFEDGSIFLTGQNGIGKSTLLRSLGINIALARALGVCFASTARVPNLLVMTSIRIEDSLELGRSLYVAELIRASEMLDRAMRVRGSLVIFDEIFRGTNHLESVSAAAAVLKVLSRHASVVVSSHNVDLAPLVAPRVRPMLLQASGAGLALVPGIIAETNGIELLRSNGFEHAIYDEASRLHTHLRDCALNPPVAALASA